MTYRINIMINGIDESQLVEKYQYIEEALEIIEEALEIFDNEVNILRNNMLDKIIADEKLEKIELIIYDELEKMLVEKWTTEDFVNEYQGGYLN